MVGTFLIRTKKSSQKVVYSLYDSQGFPKHLNVNVSTEGRSLSLEEMIQSLAAHFERIFLLELEIEIKKFLKEDTSSEEARNATALAQGRLILAFYKEAMAGRPESEYREALKALKARTRAS
jgi:hypothetical protein